MDDISRRIWHVYQDSCSVQHHGFDWVFDEVIEEFQGLSIHTKTFYLYWRLVMWPGSRSQEFNLEAIWCDHFIRRHPWINLFWLDHLWSSGIDVQSYIANKSNFNGSVIGNIHIFSASHGLIKHHPEHVPI